MLSDHLLHLPDHMPQRAAFGQPGKCHLWCSIHWWGSSSGAAAATNALISSPPIRQKHPCTSTKNKKHWKDEIAKRFHRKSVSQCVKFILQSIFSILVVCFPVIFSARTQNFCNFSQEAACKWWDLRFLVTGRWIWIWISLAMCKLAKDWKPWCPVAGWMYTCCKRAYIHSRHCEYHCEYLHSVAPTTRNV